MPLTVARLPWLQPDDDFPDVSMAACQEGFEGLLAFSGTMTPEQLVRAYRQGIFPWYSDGYPVMWWSPDPRMVLSTDKLIVSQSFRKKLRQVHRSMHSDGVWRVCFDTAFEDVMRCCATTVRKGQDGTWITDTILENYRELHHRGIAHSAEVFYNGILVGGAYGISIGRMFFGESMFFHRTDASKIALVFLTAFLKQQGVALIDCQQETAHLASLGASPMPRKTFSAHLERTCHLPDVTGWQSADCPFCHFLPALPNSNRFPLKSG